MDFPGRQRLLKGHTWTSKLNVSTVAERLPLSPADAALRVLVTSHHTNTEEITKKQLQPFVINRELVSAFLTFMVEEQNPVYAGIVIDKETLAKLPNNDLSSDMIEIIAEESKTQQATIATGGLTVVTGYEGTENVVHMTSSIQIRGAPDGTDDFRDSSAITAAGIQQTTARSATARESIFRSVASVSDDVVSRLHRNPESKAVRSTYCTLFTLFYSPLYA
jgi:hypothetical protein